MDDDAPGDGTDAEELVGKDELDEDDEMELRGEDLVADGDPDPSGSGNPVAPARPRDDSDGMPMFVMVVRARRRAGGPPVGLPPAR